MAEASKYSRRDTDSDSESDTESESDDAEEGMVSVLSKWRKVKVAVGSDVPVWLGIQSERESSKGGQKYKIGVPSGIGLGLKRAKKEQHLISRIPWQKAKGHE